MKAAAARPAVVVRSRRSRRSRSASATKSARRTMPTASASSISAARSRRSWDRAAFSGSSAPSARREEQPQLVIDALEIKPGQTIADLGAGSGYYSFRIAPLVGPHRQGARDRHRAGDARSHRRSAPAASASPTSRRCAAQRAIRTSRRDSVDLLFMVDVYHELEYPYEVMTKVRAALKPGGRVALVEYRAEDPDGADQAGAQDVGAAGAPRARDGGLPAPEDGAHAAAAARRAVHEVAARSPLPARIRAGLLGL